MQGWGFPGFLTDISLLSEPSPLTSGAQQILPAESVALIQLGVQCTPPRIRRMWSWRGGCHGSLGAQRPETPRSVWVWLRFCCGDQHEERRTSPCFGVFCSYMRYDICLGPLLFVSRPTKHRGLVSSCWPYLALLNSQPWGFNERYPHAVFEKGPERMFGTREKESSLH